MLASIIKKLSKLINKKDILSHDNVMVLMMTTPKASQAVKRCLARI